MTLALRQHSFLAKPTKRAPAPLLGGTEKTRSVLLNSNARTGGLFVLGASGAGKSRWLGRQLCFQDAVNGVGTVVFDVVSGCLSNFLDKCLYLSVPEHKELRSRIRYLNLSGLDGSVPSFPMLYRRREGESLHTQASRIADLIRQTDRKFADATIYGLKRAEPLLTAVCKVLAALELPLSHADDLLLNPEGWVDRMQKAVAINPEAKSGQKELLSYMSLSKKEREIRSEPFRNRLHLIRHNEVIRAMLASTRRPTIDWEEVCYTGQIVLVDLSDHMSKAARELCLFWVWNSLQEYIRSRKSTGRRHPPLSCVVDELAFFIEGANLNTDEIAAEFSLLTNHYMRNANIWLTVATQYLSQLPEELRDSCLHLKNHLIASSTSDPEQAKQLARRFLTLELDPWRVKYWKRVWGSDNYRGQSTYYVIDQEPVFLSLEEQEHELSRRFMELPHGSWLFAGAKGEGEQAQGLRRVSTRNLDRNQFDTCHFKEIERLKSYLMARDGIPIADVLKELEEQEISALSPIPVQHELVPAPVLPSGNGRQEASHEDLTLPITSKAFTHQLSLEAGDGKREERLIKVPPPVMAGRKGRRHSRT
jgi:hypothetical protein